MALLRWRAGRVPDKRTPMVLMSTRLTEVRGFSDFFSEFYHALEDSRMPRNLRLTVLCNKPSFEFKAFQVRRASITCIRFPMNSDAARV